MYYYDVKSSTRLDKDTATLKRENKFHRRVSWETWIGQAIYISNALAFYKARFSHHCKWQGADGKEKDGWILITIQAQSNQIKY